MPEWLRAKCVTEQHLCRPVSVIQWGRLFEFDKVETNFKERPQTNGTSVLEERVCGLCHSHPYSVATLTLTLTPAHYFLMSNHHLTGTRDRHERQLITHGKSVCYSKMIRHQKYLRDKSSPKNNFSLTTISNWLNCINVSNLLTVTKYSCVKALSKFH